MAFLSLCMIVKNEEKVLERCLNSAKKVADEIVVVDTGSSDRTKEIASDYTDLIYELEWTDDFSYARNFSFSKASGKYIMWLDADDIIGDEGVNIINDLKQNDFENSDVVMLRYNASFDHNDRPVLTYYRERIIRRSAGLIWKGRVHEAIECAGKIIYSEAAVTHASIKTKYSDRNLKIYEKQLELGEEFSPRDKFYYGRELFYHRKYSEAKEVLSEFLESGEGWLENNLEACRVLSMCYMETGKISAALKALAGSFAYALPRAEICCDMGNVFLGKGEYKNAVFWYEIALILPRNDQSGAFVSEDCYGYLPYIQLCVCYDRMGDHKKAREYNNLAWAIKPDSEACIKNEEYFSHLAGNTE
ncbi:MAG: glycosyltransferase family 2 protein [Firmicutes bacterium]|nr:glycosyltransferase family 2 protein [Bacillota bacterium]